MRTTQQHFHIELSFNSIKLNPIQLLDDSISKTPQYIFGSKNRYRINKEIQNKQIETEELS